MKFIFYKNKFISKYIVNYYNGTLKLSLEEKEKMFFLKIVIPIKKLPSNNEK